MIVVDTSVWSLAFRRHGWRGPPPRAVSVLRTMIRDDQPVIIPGIVFQELLSGVRDFSQETRLRELLEGFPLLLASREHHEEAARISTLCRTSGIAAATVDCLIAAQCITTNSALLTTDDDFKRISRHCALRLLSVAE